MAIATIVKFETDEPALWTTGILNEVMWTADDLYADFMLKLPIEQLTTHLCGLLNLQEFSVIREKVQLFLASYCILYDQEPLTKGPTDDHFTNI